MNYERLTPPMLHYQDHKSHSHHLTRSDPSQVSHAYGARYGTTPLPKFKLPSKASSIYAQQNSPVQSLTLFCPNQGVDADAAYQLIHDELALDGTPVLNLASFVHTWMPSQADKLMQENMTKNLIDQDEYPMTREYMLVIF